MSSLKSSVEKIGKVVDQVIGFSSGNKKTYQGVLTETIRQSEFTSFEVEAGYTVYVRTELVEWFEVHRRT